jgi:ribosome biogenesis GTPase / thiamine phosphate phosphatase
MTATRNISDYGWQTSWQPTFDAAVSALETSTETVESPVPARVIAAHRGAYHVVGDAGTGWAELPGRTYHQAHDRRQLPVVGDWLLVDKFVAACAGDGAARILGVLPRQSFLVRKAAGRATVPQPIVANVDIGFIVTSMNSDLSLPRIDRYVAMLADSNIATVVILSKVDLAAPESVQPAIATLLATGIPRIIAVSALSGSGMDKLRGYLRPSQTGILLGSSGVGKSTIVNALVGTARQTTQDIRYDDRGTHTTTKRELVLTADGMWIDTPGMRELARWHDDEVSADGVFEDIAALATQCRFADCLHAAEPGCAVTAAIVQGVLAEPRLRSYQKLQQEKIVQSAGQRTAKQRSEHLQKIGVARTDRQNRRR